MPLIYSALLPHSPVLMPTIGKEHSEKMQQTRTAIESIHTILTELQPDTIVIIAAHDEPKPKKLACLHLAASYTGSFEEFGDLVTKLEFSSDPVLADKIKAALKDAGFHMQYESEQALDYGASVPLSFIIKGITSKIIVINPADASLKKQFEFGKELQKVLQESEKKIACIASGDLAHTIIEGSGAISAQFDNDFIAFFRAQKIKKILQIPLHIIHERGACGIPSFVMLTGMLDHMAHTQTIHSYESPLGVGLLVADFTF